MESQRDLRFLVLTLLFIAGGCLSSERPQSARDGQNAEQRALSMIKASKGRLAPVYAPLAEQIVEDFDLAQMKGIGIDLGSGPGTLIFELCKHTQLHWINADINPHFFPYFYEQARRRGLGGRVSALFADACALPFRDNYADVIVSRGSFPFWKDQPKAFGEIYRILKPGGVAYIGRGFSRNLPVKKAKKIREGQGGKMKYDVGQTANNLRRMMNDLKIVEYKIHRPKPPGAENVNYGVWIEFHKPESGAE
jgi:SAM-dependent methyltransferase